MPAGYGYGSKGKAKSMKDKNKKGMTKKSIPKGKKNK
jgi:hypothetical protein